MVRTPLVLLSSATGEATSGSNEQHTEARMARNFVVTVKETGEGTPWLLVEPHENIGLDNTAHITMELPEGTDDGQAQRVARFLNENLAAFRISKF